MIYFGDADLVQKHLHQDLNTIIKNVKIRQQQHLELLQYNKSIANKKRTIQSTIFINDEITTHNLFLNKVVSTNKDLLKQQSQIIQKYESASVKFQSVIKLMGRVVTRILETNQSYIQKIKLFDQGFNDQFIKMKNLLTKVVNNKQQIDLNLSTKTIIEYTKNKAIVQIQKLKMLIKSLQDGQIDKVPYIYKGIKPPSQVKKVQIIKIQPPVQKKSSPIKKQQKNQTMNKIKQQIKAHQKMKKNKRNMANRLMTMYSTMDISKKQFIQDMVHYNAKQQFQKIYGEILLRNKFNKEQILEFEGKKESFEEKVRLFKELMIEESNKIQEVLMIKKTIKMEKKQDCHSESFSKLEITEQQTKNPQNVYDQSPNRQPKRSFILRQKAASPRFHNQTDMNQLRITQQNFNHIKFDTSNNQIFLRSNRNRLPSIQNKPISNSVQNPHRYHITKPKQQKGAVRKNFLMKNIQVGVQNVIKHNQHKNQSESKSIAQKLKQIQPTGQNNSNLMEFTFYNSKKKTYGLGDTKINFAF